MIGYLLILLMMWLSPTFWFIAFALGLGSVATLYKKCQGKNPVDFKRPREVCSFLVILLMRFWHGYEIVGLQNVPDEGPVLIVFYHAPLPLDVVVFASHMYLKKRPLWSVADRMAKILPFGKNLIPFANLAIEGIEQCEQLLLNGECLSVCPGGVYEMLFSDDTYKLMWNDRLGFAKLALKTNVTILPAFTKNSREAWSPLDKLDGVWKKLYAKTRWPLKLFYGGLPVKLTTVVGEPISIADCKTPTEVRDKIKKELEVLIMVHQRIPNTMWMSFIERFKVF
ncbi:TMEM68.2 family protein [Megaselia abdita]